jgi:hypothetical protein
MTRIRFKGFPATADSQLLPELPSERF